MHAEPTGSKGRGRVRSLALATLAGLLLLTGCAHDTEEALRIGDVTFSNADIEAASASYAESLGDSVTNPVGRVRESVAGLTVFREVAGRYAQEKGLTPAPPQYDAAAQALGLAPDDPYVRLNAEAFAYRDVLTANVTARTPTEAEMRDVYDRFVAIVGPDVATYADIRSQLATWPDYGRALALRDELLAAVDRYGVTVHPRYQPLDFPLLTAQGQFDLVTLPLGEQGTGAVRPAG